MLPPTTGTTHHHHPLSHHTHTIHTQNAYVKPDKPVVSYLTPLTGLTAEVLERHGVPLAQVGACVGRGWVGGWMGVNSEPIP